MRGSDIFRFVVFLNLELMQNEMSLILCKPKPTQKQMDLVFSPERTQLLLLLLQLLLLLHDFCVQLTVVTKKQLDCAYRCL